jgi:hypothetical protein
MMKTGRFRRVYVVKFPDGRQETYDEYGSLYELGKALRSEGIDTDTLTLISGEPYKL